MEQFLHSFVTGYIIGFSVAAPIGPVSLLCAGISFSEGMLTGFLSSLGASTADVLYGFVAVSGLSAVKGVLILYRDEIKIAGGIILFLLGACRFFSRRGAVTVHHDHGCERPLKGFITVFFATLSNPFTIIFFITVFSSLGVGVEQQSGMSSALFLAGIFLGTATWWVVFAAFIGALRKNLHERHVLLFNKISALLIAGLGVFAVFR